MFAVVLPRSVASRSLGALFRLGIVDETHRIASDQNYVYVPVTSVPADIQYETRQMEFRTREITMSPMIAIHEILRIQQMDDPEIPEKWVRYGSSAMIRYDGPHPREVGSAFADVLRLRSVYRISGRIGGNERHPSNELIFGPGGETTHRENGIRYRFDPAKVMFSPGNVSIRTAMKFVEVTDGVIFDMFAGIGYFSLPLARYGKPKSVIACDINPDAIAYLHENAALNGLSNVFDIRNVNCRDVFLQEKADMIVMGNFESLDYLDHAVSNLKPGGSIMMHYLCPSQRLKSPESEIFSRLRSLGFKPKLRSNRVVKSYSPHHWHVASMISINPG